ncbi:hypothetical protein, partial [Vibrio parahaemolyticus]|uniref:hypothetical protein n=1 Tax=Vibrio parahaemolyticus TaxID=670 RepID=UPI00111E4F55
MISPKKISIFFNQKQTKRDVNYFFKTHIYLEAYLKRVYLIGLRLREVQFDNSEKIIAATYMKTPQLIRKILWLLDLKNTSTSKSINDTDFKSNYADLSSFLDVIQKFSSPYRNQLAHGTIDDIRDQSTIDWLCHVNISFVKQFESTLNTMYQKSAYDKPSDWGAVRGKKEAIGQSVKRLGLGKILPAPMAVNSVKSKLAATKYPA